LPVVAHARAALPFPVLDFPPFFISAESDVAMTTPIRLALILFFSGLVLVTTGCSRGDLPDLGEVQGTVTLDGKPLAGVNVQFFPSEGRPAAGTTGSDGRYELMYTHGVSGTKVGPATVIIAWPDGEPGPVPVPAKWGAEGNLQVEVKPGSNTFDFAMESK